MIIYVIFKAYIDFFFLILKLANGILKPPVTLKCESVYGVKTGDTCFEIAQTFSVPIEFFDSINPNLNCTALFVGQWVCLNGTLS